LNASVPVVVITPGDYGHQIARSLGRLGVSVYGLDADTRSPTMRSRYWRETFIWKFHEAKPKEAVGSLLQLGRKIGSRPILIPAIDSGCTFVADYAEELNQQFLFPNQPAGLTRSLSNKQQMYYLCKKHSIPAAETFFPQCRGDVVEFMKDATFPIMLKGIDTLALQRRTGVKMVVVHDAETLLNLYDQMETPGSPNVMLQEYFSGGSQTSWMFNGYFDDESNCLFGLTAKMIRQYRPYTGRTTLGVCVANNTVARQTKEFMKAVSYRGALDIGYRYSERTGQYKMIDVNPRIGATFRLLVDTNGMDVARALYLDLTDQPIVPGRLREGRKWVVEDLDIFAWPTYRRNEKLSVWDWLCSYRGVEEAMWFASDDLVPFIAMGWRLIRQLCKKLTTFFALGR
jgi:D-aspartate ligase